MSVRLLVNACIGIWIPISASVSSCRKVTAQSEVRRTAHRPQWTCRCRSRQGRMTRGYCLPSNWTWKSGPDLTVDSTIFELWMLL